MLLPSSLSINPKISFSTYFSTNVQFPRKIARVAFAITILFKGSTIQYPMKIRTITAGIHLDLNDFKAQLVEAGSFLMTSRDLFHDNNVEVQTVRLSTQSWTEYNRKLSIEGLLPILNEIESTARENGIDFISIGPCYSEGTIEKVPYILNDTTFLCTSAFLGDIKTGPLIGNIHSAARAVKDISTISPDGSRNFMFASTASTPADIPFFPAGYHGHHKNSFTIGLESGDIVFEASCRSRDLEELGSLLAHNYNEELKKVERIALSQKEQFEYRGIDLSYAPGLEEKASIAFAIERITGSPFGSNGTLSAAAAITGSLKNMNVKRCGYSGLMLPVLEDEGLGRSADIGSLDIQKLLLYSSVCGTGLDAVPIPGDTSMERIASIISDVTYLSIKWNKPLSARLLPIPEGHAGDTTDLNSQYLKDCSILPVV